MAHLSCKRRAVMKTYLLYILSFLIFIAPAPGQAEQIPPHLATMAAQLYKGVEDNLKSKKLNPERRKVLEESARPLRGMGVHRWSTKPAKISGALPEGAERLKR